MNRIAINSCFWRTALATLLCAASASRAQSSRPATAGGADAFVVLDTSCNWRIHMTNGPPVIALEGGLKRMSLPPRPWIEVPTPTPDANWTRVDFDDSRWLRGPGRLPYQSPFVARLCMRGLFLVADPARAGRLRLSAGYRGGLIVYLNGKEIARGHLPKEGGHGAVLGEGYPAQAFTPEGGWQDSTLKNNPVPETAEQVRLRTRTLEVALPAEALRKGRNVLALEILPSPYHAIVEEKKSGDGPSRYCGYNLAFNTCEFREARLTAPAGEGLVSGATMGPGLRVWNSDPLAMDFDLDYGAEAETLAPLALTGARNGSFSGKVIAGSAQTLRGLRASITDLKAGPAVLPASRIRLRYGTPGGDFPGSYPGLYDARRGVPGCYDRKPALLGVLSDDPPSDANARAVVPVWVTVAVPKDAPAGNYTGELTVRAEGSPPVPVPVQLRVADWALPDRDDYRTWVELNQSPETLAAEYGVEPWSDRHLALIARSMDFLNESGSRIVYVPLICQTNLGNEDSMVRRVGKDPNDAEFDFGPMEKYLDVAVKHMGRPKVVCFIAWEAYLCKREFREGEYDSMKARLEARKKMEAGPIVSWQDPATRQLSPVGVAPVTDAAGRKTWTALFDELRKRMRKRGLESVMMLGWFTDDWPTKEENDAYAGVTGGLPWVFHSHYPITSGAWGPQAARRTVEGERKIGYESHIVGVRHPLACPQPVGSLYGWNRPDLYAQLDRWAGGDPGVRWRHMVEFNLTGGQRGVSRLGADTWPLPDKRGVRKAYLIGRYPQSSWRNLGMPGPLLAPGPKGALATYHFEMVRQGVQDCEARIRIEKALLDEKQKPRLGEGLARHCQECLLERTRMMLWGFLPLQLSTNRGYVTAGMIDRSPSTAGHYWFLCSHWQQRAEQLYSLAGEVERALSAK